MIKVGGDNSKEKRSWIPEWGGFSELGCKILPATFWHILCIVGRTIPNIHPTISVFEHRQNEHMVFQDPMQSLQAEIEAWMGGDEMQIFSTKNFPPKFRVKKQKQRHLYGETSILREFLRCAWFRRDILEIWVQF